MSQIRAAQKHTRTLQPSDTQRVYRRFIDVSQRKHLQFGSLVLLGQILLIQAIHPIIHLPRDMLFFQHQLNSSFFPM